MSSPNGDFVHGELATAAANGNPVPIPFYSRDCSVRTLAAGESLVIDAIIIINGGVAQTVTIGQDVNANNAFDAGETIVSGDFAISGGANPLFDPEGFWLKTGAVPSVKTSGANAVKISFTGKVIRA